jgi:hypothetical protein
VIVLLAKYNWNDTVKEDKMERACSTNEDTRNACRIFVRKPEGKISLRRKHLG